MIYTGEIWNEIIVSQNYSNSSAKNSCIGTTQLTWIVKLAGDLLEENKGNNDSML